VCTILVVIVVFIILKRIILCAILDMIVNVKYKGR
jgi:hypothetical protein